MMLRALTVTTVSFVLWLALGGVASAQTPSSHPSSTASFQVAGADIASRCMLAEVDSGSRNDFERALVDRGAHLNSRDELGLTLLHYAALSGPTSEVAAEGLRRIAELYTIDANFHGAPPQSRLAERQATVPIGAELVRRSTALPAAVLLGWIRGTHYTGGQPAKAQAIGTGGLHRRVIDRHANPLIDWALLGGADGLVTAYGGSAASTRQINDPAT